MPSPEAASAVDPPLHCDHCGRLVRETQHTRSSYTVDYYSVWGGDGEVCSFVADTGQRGPTYVKLLEPRRLTTCVSCYADVAAQRQRDHCFQPERQNESLRDE